MRLVWVNRKVVRPQNKPGDDRRREAGGEYPEYVYNWAKLATWTRIRAAPPAGAIRDALRRQAAYLYTKTYFDDYGMVPTGCHAVNFTYGHLPSHDLFIPWHCTHSNGRVIDTLSYPEGRAWKKG
jgi:hypothetical protein